MAGSGPTSSDGFMPRPSESQKWEQMKSIIHQLYIKQNKTLADVVRALREEHKFTIVEHQLKTYLRKWKFRKSIPKKAKDKMYRITRSRAATGRPTSFQYKGQDVSYDRLIRHAETSSMKDLVRKASASSSVGAAQGQPHLALEKAIPIFFKWNMPYGAMRHAQFEVLAAGESPCSGIMAITPSAAGAPSSPAGSALAIGTTSSRKLTIDKAHEFLTGYHRGLIESMTKHEKIVMSAWLYQFWLFAYRTAHHWGSGPRDWTRDLLEFQKHTEKLSLSAAPTPAGLTPAAPGSTPMSITSPAPELAPVPSPTDLCNWAIHVQSIRYQRLHSPPKEDANANGGLREGKDWPQTWMQGTSLQGKLREGLSNNSFSSMEENALPIAIPSLLRSANLPPDELLDEALAFSIIGRNVEALMRVLDDIDESRKKPEGVYPFHLAASYLNGSDTCCSIFDLLVGAGHIFPMKAHNVDSNGHTILDSLMITILKSHTSCVPGDVNEILAGKQRFEGEEVDPCGRWNPDSDVWLSLLARGEVRAPFQWKHKFCHTSAQAVCHCMALLFGKSWSPNVNGKSGLFRKPCQNQHCGHVSKLLPLHVIVMTTALLARKGCVEEDLFGMVACLLCLLRKGADPRSKADISVENLFGGPLSMMCTHRPLDATQLAEKVPVHLVEAWSEPARNGWRLFRYVLHIAGAPRMAAQPSMEIQPTAFMTDTPAQGYVHQFVSPQQVLLGSSASAPTYAMSLTSDNIPQNLMQGRRASQEQMIFCSVCEHDNPFQSDIALRDIWAGVQAEFLTYRRQRQGDHWLSERFNMRQMVKNIDDNQRVCVGFIENSCLKEVCACGTFSEAANPDIPCITEVCKEYITNMEDFARGTYLVTPEMLDDDGYAEELIESDAEEEI